MSVLAYHIIWTTYGTWLPGDARGWIDDFIAGIRPPDPERELFAKRAMSEDEVVLDAKQRALVEATIRRHCEVRGWQIHALNVRSNHIHLVVTADRKGEQVRDQLKAWCSRKLSNAAGLTDKVAKKAGRRHWFTEGGDCREIGDETYLANAIRYVEEGQ